MTDRALEFEYVSFFFESWLSENSKRVSEFKLKAAKKPVHSAALVLLSIKSSLAVVFKFPGSVTCQVFWRIPAEGSESLKGRIVFL